MSKDSKGLGDTIKKLIESTGVRKNKKPCDGCKSRQEKLNKLYDLFKEAETEVGEFDFKKWNHNDRINASCLVDEAWMEITLYLFEKEEAYGIN